MKYYLFALILILEMLSVGFLLIKTNKENEKVTAYSGVVFFILYYYIIIPLIFYIFGNGSTDSGYTRYFYDCSIGQFLQAVLGTTLFFCTFHYVYKKNDGGKSYVFNESRMLNIVKLFEVSTVLIGGGSLCVYIIAFGGVRRLLSFSEYLRSFATSGSDIVGYFASILVVPSKLIIVAPILILFLMYHEKKHRRMRCFFFVVSMILSLIYLLSNAGKTQLILFYMVFFAAYLQKKTRHSWSIILVLCCLGIPLLGCLDNLFLLLSGASLNESSFDILESLSLFTYPWSNAVNMHDIVDQYGMHWGTDFITGILNILPKVTFTPSYEMTSEFYGGVNWRIGGGTPNDVLLFGYFQFGYIGIILEGILLGIFVKRIDEIMKQLPDLYVYNLISATIIVNIFTLVLNFDTTSVIRGQFSLIITSICILYSRERLKKGTANKGIIEKGEL